MSHYDTLGVKPDATAEELKRAYRRAASAAHPDRNGGDTTKMQAINAAWDVLGNPERRRHYDETGSSEPKPDPMELIRNMVRGLFVQAIEKAVNDPVAFARQEMRGAQAKAEAELKSLDRLEKRLIKQRARVKTKGEQNLMHELIDDKLSRMVDDRKHIADIVASVKKVEELLEPYECEPDPEPEIQAPRDPFKELIEEVFAHPSAFRRR